MTFTQARLALHHHTVRAVRPGLARTRALLHQLHHPEQAFSTVHITGSNGKGSVAAMLSSIFTAAGYTVGRFTSPHLEDERERITVANTMVSRLQFARAVETLLPPLRQLKRQNNPATTFEAWTVLAAILFKQLKISLAVVEVGMGGRLDATTTWKNRILTILTNVALEHTAQLGKTRELICLEKLGITQSGVPLLSSEKSTAMRKLIRTWCRKHKVPFYFAGNRASDRMRIREFSLLRQGVLVSLQSGQRNYPPLKTVLSGTFQKDNAALAVLAAEQLQHLGYGLPLKSVVQGMAKAAWPGRMEIVHRRPLIMLDGAHNAAAMQAAAEDWKLGKRKIILITGMMKDKNIQAMCRILAPLVRQVYTVTPPDTRALDGRELAKIFEKKGKKAVACKDYRQALQFALSFAKKEQMILVTGSLYNVAPARKALKKLHLGV